MSRRFLVALLTLASAALPWDVIAQGSPVTQPFRVAFQADQSLKAPLTVHFQATVPAGLEVRWQFGDGTSAAGPVQTHVFYRPGAYEVMVEVVEPGGRVAGRAPLTLNVASNGPERAALTLLPGRGQVRVSGAGSVVYAPNEPRLSVNGQVVAAGQPVRVGNGRVTVNTAVRSAAGTTLTRSVAFTMADLGGSVPFELEVLRLTNRARATGWKCDALKPGGPARPALTPNAVLEVAALAQSAAMALTNYFSHDSPLDGSTPGRRVEAAGGSFASVAENIAAGHETPEEVVNGWLRSPGHCRAIMGDFTLIGVSYVVRPGSRYTRYWTQVFAKP